MVKAVGVGKSVMSIWGLYNLKKFMNPRVSTCWAFNNLKTLSQLYIKKNAF